MAEAIVKILQVDEAAAVDALRSIKGAMKGIQRTATQTGQRTMKMIPVKPLQQANKELVSVGGSLGLVASGLGAAGVQSSALSFGMMAAATSAEVLKGGTVKLGTALKGLMVSIGPVGWAIIAITAASVALVAVWKTMTASAERQKKALKDLANAAKAHALVMRKLALNRLRLNDQITDAAIEAVKLEVFTLQAAASDKLNAQRKALSEEYGRDLAWHTTSAANKKAYYEATQTAMQQHNTAMAEIVSQALKKLAKIRKDANIKKLEAQVTASEEELAQIQKLAQEAADALAADRQNDLNMAEAAADLKTSEEDRKARERDKEKADWKKATAEDKKDEEDAVKDAADLAKRALVNQKDANDDVIKELKKKQAAVRAANPEFRATFVGLEAMGKQIQAAAASTGEDPKSTVLTERIKNLQEKNEGIQMTIRDNGKKTVIALETIAKKFGYT